MKFSYLFLVFASIVSFAQAPSTKNSPAKPDSPSAEKQYIPVDLDDCFVQLKKILKPEDLQRIKNGSEKDVINYHFGLGMWLRNNWGLWGGSRLSTWFNNKGLFHPDDMSGVILDSFWRHLNNKPIDLDGQIKKYQEFWEKQKQLIPPPPPK